MMACTFVGQKFGERVPPGGALLRVFFADGLEMNDDEVTRLALDELRGIVTLPAQSTHVRVSRWKNAMAQYLVGHLDRVERIRERMKAHAGLHLTGAAFKGVGIPDCIREARETALGILEG